MKILGLDVSTKTGYALIENGALIKHGLIKAEPSTTYALEDFNYLIRAQAVASRIIDIVSKDSPDYIYIEQTNSGRFRGSQKQLEFIHAALLGYFVTWEVEQKVRYVDTSKWRSTLKIRLSKEQRVHNKLVKTKKARGKITPKHLAVNWVNSTYYLTLKKKDNDIADAICLAHFGMQAAMVPEQENRSTDDILVNYKSSD